MPTKENKEKEHKKKYLSITNEEYSIPEKKLKSEGSSNETSLTKVSAAGMRQTRVKPGTSLLLKRK